ncbi:MAG TPA: hypothetical protein VNY09_01340, partial [Candidatus Sulfotelmatobacter sp.]|nr:hypothetical protein [Candidatus Sulfotelmatobacter sp.]
MNRRPDVPGPFSVRNFPLKPVAFFFLAVVCFFVFGCKKKPTPLSNVAIRNITREFVFAARNASGGRA